MDHTIIEEIDYWTSPLYNTLREDGSNFYITKMRPILAITRKP